MKKIDLYIIIGVFCNLLLVLFFVYLYFSAIPNSDELVNYTENEVKGLSIYNENLEKEINRLRKSDALPINIDPNEIGKENPYNF
uniref:Uncharacterized protein n=1 Tax=candidate division CPR3 bacterium TaxID=2268181 RepID=A0A7C4QWR2_UNCC3